MVDIWEELSKIMHEEKICGSIKDDVFEILRKEPEKLNDVMVLLNRDKLKEDVLKRFEERLTDFEDKFRLTVVDGSGELDEVLKAWHEKVAQVAIATLLRMQRRKEQEK